MRKIVLFSLLVALSLPAFSVGTGFRFGLKTSPNISWFRTETRGYENNGVKLGFAYGLITDYYFAENYAISTGVNIARFGGKIKYNYRYTDQDQQYNTTKRSDYSFRYLEIPMTLKLRATEVGFSTFYGQFGFGLGFRTKAEADQRINLVDGSRLERIDVDVVETTRFMRGSLIIGGGVEYNMGGRTSLLGGLTFHNGFSNFLDTTNPAVATTPSAVNSYFELTLGIMF